MTSFNYVVDSNVFTDILRKRESVVERFIKASAENHHFLLCPVVFYEVYRGLRYRDAKKQLSLFLAITSQFIYGQLDDGDWRMAGDLWAELRTKGLQVSDADLLIGIFAQRRNAIVVTDNIRHFAPLNISVENWRSK